MNKISTSELKKLIDDSVSSPRKRAALSMHPPEHKGSRFLAVCLQPDSYMTPHSHGGEFPEVAIHIQGRICILYFDSKGNITEKNYLSNEENKVIQTPSGTFHTAIALTDDAVLFEVTQGPYNAESYKTLAKWAPEEKDSLTGKEYLEKLKSEL